VLGFVLLASPFAEARNEAEPDLRLKVADDFYYARGSVVVSGRYGGAWGVKVGVWARDSNAHPGAPNYFAGVDHVWSVSRWRLGLGSVFIDELNELNGTHLDFDITAAYDLTDRVFVEYQHFSHGKKLGIKRHAYNHGWNLIGVGVIF